ncbi:MAG: aldo/keto reductase [Flavisolibacter sp.]
MVTRIIPASGESIPVVGLGTWQTFDISSGKDTTPLKEVLQLMQAHGGKLIDSSPMYGRSEEIIGRLLGSSDESHAFFYATKVWIRGENEGIQQMESSMSKMQRRVMDLMQIHNLVDWKIHLKTLRKWKDEGKIRYIGITHYQDSMHSELENIIKSEKIDFVQFNYSIFSRNAEKRLLNVASERGVATLINRPFGEGSAFERIKGKKLPLWAKEYGIETWGQFFLKYIISHPGVTCVIPATGNPDHMNENLKAGEGELPEEDTRQKMVKAIS